MHGMHRVSLNPQRRRVCCHERCKARRLTTVTCKASPASMVSAHRSQPKTTGEPKASSVPARPAGSPLAWSSHPSCSGLGAAQARQSNVCSHSLAHSRRLALSRQRRALLCTSVAFGRRDQQCQCILCAARLRSHLAHIGCASATTWHAAAGMQHRDAHSASNPVWCC